MTNRALLVVDMQNGFCHPEGSFSQIGMGLEGAQAAVFNAAVAVAQARRAAIPVVFTRHVYRPGRADEGGALIRNSPALAGHQRPGGRLLGRRRGGRARLRARGLGGRQGALRRLPVDLARAAAARPGRNRTGRLRRGHEPVRGDHGPVRVSRLAAVRSQRTVVGSRRKSNPCAPSAASAKSTYLPPVPPS